MNIVIYARYSSDKQTEASIEGQLKTCYEFARNNNCVVIGEYIDRALTGTSDRRPEFQRMIEDSKKKKFEAVLVYQLDRFSRDKYDNAVYKQKLKQNGVRVISAKENITTDASGILLESMLEGLAEYYSVELRQKVTRGMRITAEKAGFTGGPIALGYKAVDKHFQIDEPNALVVQEIFKMYSKDKTVKEIIDYLNAKQIKTAKGGIFNKNSLNCILKNKKYIGTYNYADIIIENAMPRIISDELFEEVQQKLELNKKAPARARAKEEYLLTTKLFCGHCKNMMVGVSGKSKTGKKHTYYTCKNVLQKKSNKKQIQKQWIEDIVVNKCREILTDENISLIAKATVEASNREQDNSILKIMHDQLKGLTTKQGNLMQAVAECPIETVRKGLYEELNKVMNDKQELEIQLTIEENKASISLTEPQVKFFLNKLKCGNINDIKNRRALIAVFVNAIYLYDEQDVKKKKITFFLNAGDKPVEITETLLVDIEAASNSSYIDCHGAP